MNTQEIHLQQMKISAPGPGPDAKTKHQNLD